MSPDQQPPFRPVHESVCPAPTGGECHCRADRLCPKCGEIVRYDGWDHVHPSGLGIGSCRDVDPSLSAPTAHSDGVPRG